MDDQLGTVGERMDAILTGSGTHEVHTKKTPTRDE